MDFAMLIFKTAKVHFSRLPAKLNTSFPQNSVFKYKDNILLKKFAPALKINC
jgi:hypothetical protein